MNVDQDLLHRFVPFAALKPGRLAVVIDGARLDRLPGNAVLFRQGDENR